MKRRKALTVIVCALAVIGLFGVFGRDFVASWWKWERQEAVIARTSGLMHDLRPRLRMGDTGAIQRLADSLCDSRYHRAMLERLMGEFFTGVQGPLKDWLRLHAKELVFDASRGVFYLPGPGASTQPVVQQE